MVLADQNNSSIVPESNLLKSKKLSSTTCFDQYENLEFHTKIRLRTFSMLVQSFVEVFDNLNYPFINPRTNADALRAKM